MGRRAAKGRGDACVTRHARCAVIQLWWTTLLSTLLGEVPSTERLLIIEDSRSSLPITRILSGLKPGRETPNQLGPSP